MQENNLHTILQSDRQTNRQTNGRMDIKIKTEIYLVFIEAWSYLKEGNTEYMY